MPPSRSGAGLASAAAVAASAVVSGVGSYVLLILVAKSVSATAYAEFAVFWSIAVTVGLGVYFPIEQETARDFAGRARSPRGSLRRVSYGFAAIVSLVLAVGVGAMLFVPQAVSFVGSSALILALCAALVGYLVQFPTRGVLSGARRTDAYAAVVSTEGLLRVLLPATIALVGVTDPAIFALTVAIAAAASAIPILVPRFRVQGSPDGHLGVFSSRAIRLVVAALAIQLLLNSGVLIARSAAGADAALAGQVLTTLSIARIPVFAYQALQVLYMPRLAAAWKSGARAEARRTIVVVVTAVACVGAVTVAGMLVLGPWVIGLFFTPELVLATGPLLLLTAGVAVFLLAQVLSDAALALGSHSALVVTWVAAVVVAVLTMLVISDPVLRAVVPLLAGTIVAAAAFACVVSHRMRRTSVSESPKTAA